MSTERDELVRIYVETLNEGHGMVSRIVQGNRAADAILAAGWVKPCTITTAEELDALPVGSVVLDRLDICYRLYNDPAHKEPVWCVVGELAPSSPRGWLPATVLHEGQA